MSDSQPSLEIYKKGQDAADKFDYFVCGVAGAVFAYDAEHYVPRRLDFSFHSLESVSLLLLPLAFVCGVQKLRYSVRGTHINHGLNDSEEKSLKLALELEDDKKAKEPKYGEASRQMMIQDIRKHRANVDILAAQLSKVDSVGRRWYIARDILLVSGFVAIYLSKVLQPYGADSSPHATATAPPAHIQSPAAHPSANPDLLPLSQHPPTNQTSKDIRP
jgi:hypothetical protein